MIAKIITIILQVAISFLKEDERLRLKTELEAILGRQDSIAESYEEQASAEEDANAAVQNVENQGSDTDVFGSEEYNNDN